LVKTYALEVEKSNLRVNILNPGAIRTAMRARAVPGEDPSTLDTPADIAPLILKICSSEFQDNGKVVDYRKYKNGETDIFL
jgi:NAD(P)-dependent dehydrogenase (short-subunit alcohol dehydrogenase family)